MAKISSMMDIGKRSMMNSQTALQTVSHNIANKSTEGYSRQRVDIQSAPPIGQGRLQMGMGARAAAVTRTNNPYLEKQLQKEQGSLGFHEARSEALARVEQVFNEQANKGLNQYMTDFFNAFRELSNNPESVTTRTMVKEAGEALTLDFKRVHTQLSEIQKGIDENIKNQMEEVNKMSAEIADLNQKIAQTEVQGMPANDQRDRRETLLKKMSDKIDIHYAEGNTGMINVTTAGNAILVSGVDHYELSHHRSTTTDKLELYYKPNESTPPFKITDRIRGGQIGGALQVRDKTIESLHENVNSIAINLASEVNRTHRLGFDKSGAQGEDFFHIPENVNETSAYLKVNSTITEDVNRIAAGSKPGAIGDNLVANVISQMQFREIMEGGTSTIDDFYNSQVGSIGVIAERANKSKESQDNVVKQLNTIRESISGVSLDEETTKMIEFQKAFDASARVIRVADEMFDTVLNLKRL